MEVYQITTTCAECKTDIRVIIAEESTSASCDACGFAVIKAKRFAGVIYVMSNPKVEGVKIGMTSRNVFTRAKQISGTGVPGSFAVIAAFPSNNPARDERKIHEKLARKRIGKEHFELDPVTAVLRIRTILTRDWVYLKRDHERHVSARLSEQREKARNRFAGNGKKESQIDLFDDASAEHAPSEPVQIPGETTGAPPPPKGFLANLFN